MKTIMPVLLAVTFMLVPAAVLAETGEELAELLGVHLGRETRIADVQKRFADSRLIETGDAGEYEASVCYYVAECAMQRQLSPALLFHI